MDMALEAVGDLALSLILTKLGPKETAKVACLSKKFRNSASEESLWSQFCLQDLDLSSPTDPQGNLVPSFKAAYQLWQEAFGMYPLPLVKRVKRCWDRLKKWLTTSFPEAATTLRKGASEDQIRRLEKLLQVKLPVATRILYRFCDGQDLAGKDFPMNMDGSILGLIGGYSCSNQLVNVHLLPLQEVMVETMQIRRHLRSFRFSNRAKCIIVAASSTVSEKLFFLSCTDGQLYVGTRNFPVDAETMPCVPSALIQSVHDYNSDQQQDALLLWLEEHARRLENGIIKLKEEGNIKSICQFPEEPPLCSTAITNGVKVRASAIFMPELADLQGNSQEKYWFSYSISMSLLPEGCVINGIYFSSCQLHWRHWIIRAKDAVVANVNGEAVVGKFPLLHPDEKEFVYQSCTPLATSSGSVEGSFTFVPGRLAAPKGGPFEVEVARFPLQVPDYIF